jgi:hypothetical protein
MAEFLSDVNDLCIAIDGQAKNGFEMVTPAASNGNKQIEIRSFCNFVSRFLCRLFTLKGKRNKNSFLLSFL